MAVEMTYHEVDGLLYPDIEMPVEQDKELLQLGKYGRMALQYLKDNEPMRYRTLYRFGMLAEKMREVDEEAWNLMEMLQNQYLSKNKTKNPSSTMEMWKIREQARMQAEEIVLHQIVMKFH